MFFPEKITAIQSDYRVLEIGPGSSPHPRSNAFLELEFSLEEEKIAQRGGLTYEAEFGSRPVHYYNGGVFPFHDNQFDYVICSHVVEHVDNPDEFMREVFRVGNGRGYIEYPMITYEYLYDFGVHLHFVKFDREQNVLRYLPKRETPFHEFSGVSAIFYRTLECGWDDLCAVNKELFFEGIEFKSPFTVGKTDSIEKLLPPKTLVKDKSPARRLFDRFVAKFHI